MKFRAMQWIGPRRLAVLTEADTFDTPSSARWPGEAVLSVAPDRPAAFTGAPSVRAGARRAPRVRDMINSRDDREARSSARPPTPRRRPFAEARRPRVTRAGWAFIAAMLASAALWALVVWIAAWAVGHGGPPAR